MSMALVEHSQGSEYFDSEESSSAVMEHAPLDEGTSRLADAVATLRAREDDILAILADVDQRLHSLDARRVHADAGFEAFAELEGRLLKPAPLLRSMREAVPREVIERP